MENNAQLKFSIEKTNYIKGIAILLMIIHHLFWNVPGYGIIINGMSISQRIGVIGKVCVTLFLILSGYGLYLSTKNHKIDKISFYKKRLLKLFPNYWIIVIFSLIIGFIFFRTKLIDILAGNAPIKIILTLTGLPYLLGYQFLNASWWFMSIILFYYVIFPYIKFLLDKYDWKSILVFLPIWFLPIDIPIFNIKEIIFWFLPFFIGMYFAKNNSIEKIENYLIVKSKFIKVGLLFLVTIILLYNRQFMGVSEFGNRLDVIIGILIISIATISIDKLIIIKKPLVFLGVHSFKL